VPTSLARGLRMVTLRATAMCLEACADHIYMLKISSLCFTEYEVKVRIWKSEIIWKNDHFFFLFKKQKWLKFFRDSLGTGKYDLMASAGDGWSPSGGRQPLTSSPALPSLEMSFGQGGGELSSRKKTCFWDLSFVVTHVSHTQIPLYSEIYLLENNIIEF
jgi:hypothetical protein